MLPTFYGGAFLKTRREKIHFWPSKSMFLNLIGALIVVTL
jgi:hypothetical protein